MVKVKSRWDIFAFQLRIINWHLLNISKWIYTSFPQAFIFVLVASHFQIYSCVVRVNTKLSLKNSFKRGGDTRGEQEAPVATTTHVAVLRHWVRGSGSLVRKNLSGGVCIRSRTGKTFKRKQRKGSKENRMTN